MSGGNTKICVSSAFHLRLENPHPENLRLENLFSKNLHPKNPHPKNPRQKKSSAADKKNPGEVVCDLPRNV